MNFPRIGAYLRQPTTLFALADIIGTLVALWFGALGEVQALALLTASVPLLASDNSSIIARILAQRNDLASAVHAVATHKDIGPAAVKVIADAIPGGQLVAEVAEAQLSTTKKVSTSPLAMIGLFTLLSVGLSACGADQVVQRQQSVYALDLSYAVAAQVAAGYEKNPAADAAVVTKMKPAFQTAHDQISKLVAAARAGDPITAAEIEAAQDSLDAARKYLPAK